MLHLIKVKTLKAAFKVGRLRLYSKEPNNNLKQSKKKAKLEDKIIYINTQRYKACNRLY